MSIYYKIVFLVMITFSLLIITGSEFKNEILGFLLIMVHHTIMTYKLIINIKKNGFLNFKNIELLSYMIIFTALAKMSIGYTNGAVIVNDIMGINIDPSIARIGVLLIFLLILGVPMFIYDKFYNEGK